MRLYVAGPMSPRSFGLEETPASWDYNYPAFIAAAEELAAAGFEVVSPAAPGQVDGWPYGEYVRRGLVQLLTADGVAVLDGWQRSTGARLEVEVASTAGMPVMPLADWLTLGRVAPAVLSGPRSRFAVALAEALPEGWFHGAGVG